MGEVTGRGEAGRLGYLRNTVICTGQQLLAGLYSYLAQVADGGTAEIFVESVYNIIFIQVGHLRQGIQRDIPGVVGIDVLLQLQAFPAGFHRRRIFIGKMGTPQKPGDHDLEKVLADQLIPLAAFLHLF